MFYLIVLYTKCIAMRLLGHHYIYNGFMATPERGHIGCTVNNFINSFIYLYMTFLTSLIIYEINTKEIIAVTSVYI